MEEYNSKVQAAETEKTVWDNIMSEIEKRDYARMQQEEAEAKAKTDVTTEQPKPKVERKKNTKTKKKTTKAEDVEQPKVEQEQKEVEEPKSEQQKVEPEPKEKEDKQQKKVEGPKAKKNEGQFGLVSDERMEELKRRLREKLGQLNVGIDPEMLSLGMELAAGHIDRGIKKFADFAKVMIDDLGDAVRPYIKAFYNGAHDMIEDGGHKELADEMTPYDEVRAFDITNFMTDVEDENVVDDKQKPEVNDSDNDASDNTPTQEEEDEPLSVQIDEASADVNTNPTDAQKEAGNYKMGHVQVGTFDITIEQPKGSIRRGTDADGKKWESEMHNTYGYIRGTEGVDGDHIDVFLSNDIDYWNGRKVFVVDQYNPDGTFDEHKVMLGFNDGYDAKSDYLANYEKGWEDGRRIDVTAVNLEDFEKWIDSSHRKTKPFSEYVSVSDKQTVTNGHGLENESKQQTDKYGIPTEAKTIWSGELDGYGYEIGYALNHRIIIFHNAQTGMNVMRVNIYDKNAKTPARIRAILEKEGYNIDTDGSSSGFVEFDNYDDAKKFSDHMDDMQKQVDESRDSQGNPVSFLNNEERAAFIDNVINSYPFMGGEYSFDDFWIDVSEWMDEHPTATEAEIRAYAKEYADDTLTDSQGNPVNEDGILKVEKIESVDELTDEDFSEPTRNVELPTLPKNVDAAIGANGKPVVIKKNIFERNAERHPDISAKQSREILKSALYNPDLYGQNQKAKRPYNWIVINTKDEEGKNRLVLLEVSPNKDNIEIVHWHYTDERGIEKIKRQAEREDGQLLILPSENSEEAGALSSPTPDLSSEDKGTNNSENKQEDKAKNNDTSIGNSFEERVKSIRVEDIDKWDKSIDERCTESYKQKAGKRNDGFSVTVGVNKDGELYINKKGKGGYILVIKDAKNYTVDEIRSRIDIGIGVTIDEAMAISESISTLGHKLKSDYHVSLFKENGITRTLGAAKTISDLYGDFNKQSDTHENESILDKANRIADEQKQKREAKKAEEARQWEEAVKGKRDLSLGDEEVEVNADDSLKKDSGLHFGKEKRKNNANLKDFIHSGKDLNIHAAIHGIHYENGYTIAADGGKLAIIHCDYQTEYEGKTITLKGEEIKRKYPNTFSVIPKTGIPFNDTASIINEFKLIPKETMGIVLGGLTYANITISPLIKLAKKTKNAQLYKCANGMIALVGDGVFACCMPIEESYSYKDNLTPYDYSTGGNIYDIDSQMFYSSESQKWVSVKEGIDKDIIKKIRDGEVVIKDEGGKTIIVDAKDGKPRYQKTETAQVNADERERALRDAVIDKLRESGMDVVTDEKEGQRVLDMANGEERLNAKKRRALETASLGETPRSLTVVSSADGAKILKSIDTLVSEFEKSATQPKTFVGDVAKALGAKRYGSASEYATFETKNGKIVTIRLSNHNAKVSNFDVNNEADGISIVVSPKKSEGITYDGNAHVVEYYYDAIQLRRVDGKPLADIVRSIKQALYSGEFEDTTGLAERQEVNAEDAVRYNKVYHGSGANFDHFDHSHMGEGEGAQAYGWGTYVTEVEGIGRTYANAGSSNHSLRVSKLESDISRAEQRLPFLKGEVKEEEQRQISQWKQELEQLKNEAVEKHLYTVEIPDDTGENYISWNEPLTNKQLETIRKGLVHLMQSPAIPERLKEKLLEWNNGYRPVVNIIDGSTGRRAYEDIKSVVFDEYASKFLSTLGFTGIKYPADYMRGGNEDEKKNYVIFDEKDAKITDHVRFFRTSNGEAYGYTIGGKIYIDPRIANSETPIHEYAHLWATALRKGNAKEWKNVVGLMKGTKVWSEIKERYPELRSDEEIADEVLATYSGRRGTERLREEMKNAAESGDSATDKATAVGALERVKRALDKFWRTVADFLHIHYTSAEEVADRVMKDLMDGVDPRKFGMDEKVREQFIGERGAENADRTEEVNTRLDNLRVAREMESEKKDAKAIKMATGWERGADGKWRYEIADVQFKKSNKENLFLLSTRTGDDVVQLSHMYNNDKPLLSDWVDSNETFKAYPQLKHTRLIFDPNMSSEEYGYYNAKENAIVVNSNKFYPEMQSAITHEVQHAIQRIEGFARGGSMRSAMLYLGENKAKDVRIKANLFYDAAQKKNFGITKSEAENLVHHLEYEDLSDEELQKLIDELCEKHNITEDELEDIYPMDASFEAYRRMAGEVEARNVQKRMRMTPEERRQSIAAETEDVAREDQIFLNGSDVAANDDNLYREGDTKRLRNGASITFRRKPTTTYKAVKRWLADNGIEYSDHTARTGSMYMSFWTDDVEYNIRNSDHTAPEYSGASEYGRGESVSVYDNRVDTVDIDLCNSKLRTEDVRSLVEEVSELNKESDAVRTAMLRDRIVSQDVERKYPVLCVVLGIENDEERRLKDAYAGYVKGVREEMMSGFYPFTASNGIVIEEDGTVSHPTWQTIWKGKRMDAEMELYRAKAKIGEEAKERAMSFDDWVNAREDDELEKANERFNERLDSLMKDPSQKGRELQLGRPGQFLKDAGLADSEIVLDYDRLVRKASEEYRNSHPFSMDEIKDLPKAINFPIVVFDNTNGESRGKVILTELAKDGKNFIVAVRASERHQKGGVVLEVNEIRTLFPKESRGIVNWLNTGKASNINKEKALAWLGALRTHRGTELTEQELSDAAKVIENFENPKTLGENIAENDENSESDDLYRVVDDAESGVLSKGRMPLRERMAARVSELAGKLHLDNVEVVADGSSLEGRRRKAKGFYNKKTGKITIVVGNHGSVADVERTLLHEAVAHYGLRRLLGKGFETFLDYVFLHAKGKARERISEAIRERGMDYRTATEEYLASMAETENFESPWAVKWLHELKHAFVRLLNKIGFSLGSVTMSDNDMKYWLWRSYENLRKPKAERGMIDVANDIAMQSRLGVGEFADDATKQEEAEKERAENDLLFRQASYKTAREMYDGIERKFFTRLTEAWQDSMKAVKVLQDAVAKFSGKPIKDFEDAYSAENRMHGTMKNKAERFMQQMYKPLIASVRDLMQEGGYTQKDVTTIRQV